MTTPPPAPAWPLDGAEGLRDALVAAYREPHRGYHDDRHLAEVLDCLDLLLDEHPVADPTAVRLAAWFHDAVYAGRAGEDEEASARWAEEALEGLVPDDTRIEVARLVRLTVTHDPAPDDLAGAVLSDADLAVLAADPDRYADYRRGVRHEHADVPAGLFAAGRSGVLESLLAAPVLFRTPTGRVRWEDRARANVAEELHVLAVVRHHDADEGRVEFVDVEGFTPGPVVVVDHDPGWPDLFGALARALRDALGGRVLGLEHVGSTAVPDLPAKPVVDVDLTVADPADEAAYVGALRELGYLFVLREPGWHEHRCFRLPDPAVNLHVFGPGCPETVRHVLFRDWLRSHPEDRDRYAEVKRAAAHATTADGGHVMDYNARKQEVVRAIYDRLFTSQGWL